MLSRCHNSLEGCQKACDCIVTVMHDFQAPPMGDRLELQTIDREGKYVYLRDIGNGAFGQVLLAKDVSSNVGELTDDGLRSSGLVAIKRLERSHPELHYVESELINHSQLNHPHVVKFREVFLTDKHINVVMEYANGGSLFQYVKLHTRLREPLARWFFQQLILAVDYCHGKGVANRDIKLENILLAEVANLPRPLVKICDFGYSKNDNRSAARSQVGTPAYMGPEVLQSVTYDGKAADIWSCGIVLYTMLVGRYPFLNSADGAVGLGAQFVEMLRRMNTEDYCIPESLGLSPGCCSLLRALLQPKPERRISMADIKAHPWFLTDLPPKAINMNNHYLSRQRRPCVQTEDEIRAIVRQAGRSR